MKDFTEGDQLVFNSGAFEALFLGGIGPETLAFGTKATTTDQHVIYDQTTGYLYYDADGSSVGAKVLVATLVDRPILDAGDFWVG